MHRFASRASRALSLLAVLASAGCPETNLSSDTVYPAGTLDLTTSARAMVTNLRAYFGLTP